MKYVSKFLQHCQIGKIVPAYLLLEVEEVITDLDF